MTYTAPPYLVWVLLGVGLAIASFLTYRESRKSKEKPQIENLERVAVSILSKIHKRDLKLKNAAKKQYLTLFRREDLEELWDNYAMTKNGETYESIKKEFGDKKLEKDKTQRRKQIDDLQQRLTPITKQEGLEDLVKLANFVEQFPKTQNSAYQGIGKRRQTDRRWQSLFHSLNNLRLEHAQIFADKELTQMIDEYFDNSKVSATISMLIEFVETFIPSDLLPTVYLKSDIQDADINISNRMTKLLEDISKKITKLKSR